MTKQQKIMLGILCVGAIGYYLWKKNKDKQLATQIEKMTELNEKYSKQKALEEIRNNKMAINMGYNPNRTPPAFLEKLFGNKNNSIGLGEGSQNKGVAMQTQPIPNDNVVASNPNTPRSVETMVSKNPIGNSESPKAKRDLYFQLIDLELDFATSTPQEKAMGNAFNETQKKQINSLSDEKLEVGFKNVSSQELKEGINMFKQAMANKNMDDKSKIKYFMNVLSNKLGSDINVIDI
jgi:hypothetical protein